MKCPPKFYNFNIIQQDPDVSDITFLQIRFAKAVNMLHCIVSFLRPLHVVQRYEASKESS